MINEVERQKGNIVLAVIAGLGAGAIVVGSWLFVFQSLFYTPENGSILGSGSVEATENWREYTNEEGFKLKYPPSWESSANGETVTFSRQQSAFQNLRSDEVKKDFEFRLLGHDNRSNLELSNWLESYLEGKDAKKKDVLTVNKKTAKRYYGLEGSEKNVDVFLALNSQILQFSLVSLDGNDYTDKGKNPYPQRLFFQTLQTLNF